MPTQRFEGKRVEERLGEGEAEREKERTHAGEGERERELWLLLLCFFLPLGLPCANWAQPALLIVPAEVFTLVLGPSLFF